MSAPEQVAFMADIVQIGMGLGTFVFGAYGAIRLLKRVRIVVLPDDDGS